LNRVREKRYKQLRAIRQERDYQSGTLQYSNRPYNLPTARVNLKNGKVAPVYVTTNQFIKKA
jgi:hypothetical protein